MKINILKVSSYGLKLSIRLKMNRSRQETYIYLIGVVMNNEKPNLGIAAVLSFFFPGVGQIYKKQIIRGIFYFCAIGLLYHSIVLIPVAVVCHLLVIIGASRPIQHPDPKEVHP
jgi:TM2 domain-containing membrane protein YozV